jgi:hypothetical protein
MSYWLGASRRTRTRRPSSTHRGFVTNPSMGSNSGNSGVTTSRHSPRIGSPASHQPSAFALRARLNQVDSYRAHQLNSQQVNEFRLRLVFDQICCRRAVWHQWGAGTSVALRTREYQRDSSSLPLGRSDDWGRQTKKPALDTRMGLPKNRNESIVELRNHPSSSAATAASSGPKSRSVTRQTSARSTPKYA